MDHIPGMVMRIKIALQNSGGESGRSQNCV